jgi:hypothetical protein
VSFCHLYYRAMMEDKVITLCVLCLSGQCVGARIASPNPWPACIPWSLSYLLPGLPEHLSYMTGKEESKKE